MPTDEKNRTAVEEEPIRAGQVSWLPHAPETRVRTGIIGCGSRGRAFANTNRIRFPLDITHVYDVSDESIEKVRQEIEWEAPPAVCSSAEELCALDEVEAVIITTPAHLHMEALRAAVEHGKHILLDKPISATIEEAAAMAELVEGYEPVCYVGMQYREMSINRKLREIVDSGRLGDLKMSHIAERRQPYFPKWNEWNKFSEMSGGAMVEKCCHFFDLFNYYAQSTPRKVYSCGGRDVAYGDFSFEGRPADIIDNSFTIVEMENGIRAGLHFCMFDRQPDEGQKITLNGSGGSAYAEGGTFFLHVGSNAIDDVPEDIQLAVPDAIRNSGHNGGDYYELERFRRAVRGGRRDLPSMRDGYWAIVAGVAAERSIRTGEPVLVADLV
jgi:predicted dehydrogenase